MSKFPQIFAGLLLVVFVFSGENLALATDGFNLQSTEQQIQDSQRSLQNSQNKQKDFEQKKMNLEQQKESANAVLDNPASTPAEREAAESQLDEADDKLREVNANLLTNTSEIDQSQSDYESSVVQSGLAVRQELESVDANLQDLNREDLTREQQKQKIDLLLYKQRLLSLRIDILRSEVYQSDDEDGAAASELIEREEQYRNSAAEIKKLRLAIITNYKVGASSDLTVDGQTKFQDAPTLIARIIDGLVLMLGTIAFIFIVIAGFRMVISGGDDTELQKAKEMLKMAIIGLIVSLLAYIIVAAVQGLIYR